MPESFGKRQRREVNQKKAVTRDERRVARAQRKKDREAGLIEPGTPLATPETSDYLAEMQEVGRATREDADKA